MKEENNQARPYSAVILCRGNAERSCLGEAAMKFTHDKLYAEKIASDFDGESPIGIKSAGAIVSKFYGMDIDGTEGVFPPLKTQLKILTAAVNYHAVGDDYFDMVNKYTSSFQKSKKAGQVDEFVGSLGEEDKSSILLLYQKFRPVVHGMAAPLRELTIERFEIDPKYSPHTMNRRLRAEDKPDMIIPVEDKANELARKFYNNAEPGRTTSVYTAELSPKSGLLKKTGEIEVVVPKIRLFYELAGETNELPDQPGEGLSVLRKQFSYFLERSGRVLHNVMKIGAEKHQGLEKLVTSA